MSTTDSPQPAAFAFGRTRDWPGYFRAVAQGEPRQTLLDALALFDADGLRADRKPFAIDLGAGEGRDTAELLRRGWAVLATDGHPKGIELLTSRPDLTHADRLTARVETFETLSELPAADLINASFSLPFCHPEHFERVWKLIVDALPAGGRFAGQIFGDRDGWAGIPDRSHFSRTEAERLFEGFLLESFREDEKDAKDAAGNQKHWHLFHVVARKLGG
ncbi:MAG: class I SAM-dependent methyltransferase [Planctomycetota bacterium]